MQKLSLTVLWVFLVTSLGCNMVQSNQLTQTERVAMLLEEFNSKNLRAVHMGGNWGTNRNAVHDPPSDYFDFLHRLNVNWVGISVALYVNSSMDSNVRRVYSGVDIPTFTDEALVGTIQALHQHGFNVYLTLAFENLDGKQTYPLQRWQLGDPYAHENDDNILPESWPWDPSHPDHEHFVREFWKTYTEQAVHFGKIAEAEGVKLYSLGTETDRLFRSRSGRDDRRSSRNSRVWSNDFGPELKTMVHSVREVYSGLLTYDMHYSVLTAGSFYKQGSEHLWEDIGLDVVGVSAYFPLVDAPPLRVMTIEELEECWEHIFQEFMYPLQDRNPGRPILFLEFGYVDSAASPHNPSSEDFAPRSFSDTDENGVDDGEETQANIYQAFFNVMDRHSGVVRGAFLWDTVMASDENYARSFAQMRCFNIRGKLAEQVVGQRYAVWRSM